MAPTPALALCGTSVAAVADWNLYSSVEDAVASGASVVEVCPGVYEVQLNANGIELRSASGDPSDTWLSGGGTHTILRGDGLRVSGLGFVDGFSTYAGGAIEATGLDVHCSIFQENYAHYEGGAIAVRGDAWIEGSVFLENYADYEGGAVSWGDWNDHELHVLASTFEGNQAGYEGSAIEIGTWAYDTVSIAGSTFTANHDPGPGSVNFGSWGGFDAVIQGCTFTDNDQAIGLGGRLEDGYDLQVLQTTIVGDPGSW